MMHFILISIFLTCNLNGVYLFQTTSRSFGTPLTTLKYPSTTARTLKTSGQCPSQNDQLLNLQTQITEMRLVLDKIAEKVLPKILLEENFSDLNNFATKWKPYDDEKFIKYKKFEIGGSKKSMRTKPESGSYCIYSQIPEYSIKNTPLEIKFSVKISKSHHNSAYFQLNNCDLGNSQNDKLTWDSYILRFGPSFGGGFGNSIYFGLNGEENFMKIMQNSAKDDGIEHDYILILDPRNGGSFKVYMDGKLITQEHIPVSLSNLGKFCKVSICTQNEHASIVEIDDIILDTKVDSC